MEDADATLSFFSFLLAGFLMFKDFCENVSEEPVPQIAFYEEVSFIYIFKTFAIETRLVVKRTR